MSWVGRAVGDRFGPARLLPLLIGPGYLLLLQHPRPTAADWVVVLAAAGVFLAGGRWPLPTVIGESALIVGAHQWADSPPIVAKILASVALLELAVRRPARRALLGAAALVVAYFAIYRYPDPVTDVLAVVYRLVTVAGVPVLLGAYLRAGAATVRQARARAREAEERRELAARGARLAERTEIARELHDMVAHHVASMALRVGVARAVVPNIDPRIGEVLDDVHGSATTALADLRRLVELLRDPATVQDGVPVQPGGLPAALDSVVRRSARAGLDVEPSVDAGVGELDSITGLAVLRLVQEGLTNTSKHAGVGATVQARVHIAAGSVRIEVTDDGGALGNAARLPPAGPGYGLLGLRERVELVGGTLTAGPLGGGWRLAAELPVRVPPDDQPTPACRT